MPIYPPASGERLDPHLAIWIALNNALNNALNTRHQAEAQAA